MATTGRSRPEARLKRARVAIGLAIATLIAAGTTVPTPLGTPSASAQMVAAASIQAQQASVVTANHQPPLSLAELAVSEYTAAVDRDSQALAADRADQARSEAAAAAAADRLGHDRIVLARATDALDQANQRLLADRAKLRGIAVGLYTGSLAGAQPGGVMEPSLYDRQVILTGEVETVAGVVGGDLHQDLATARADSEHRSAAAGRVASDERTQAMAADSARSAAARTAVDSSTVAADQARLDGANRQLDSAETALTVALHSLAGPSDVPPGQLSILGGAALTPAQLAGWFGWEGYVDLTSAPIQQLAAWYIQAGAQEGVRGDVAFAQAVLETGGFSSPDAVGLSNFAGIGHCDTCSSGWAFPSPQGGVIGQIQLLRIFAEGGPAPAGAPAPVLPSLTSSQEGRAGCCPTVEALTGVWASDPTYGQQILAIYGQMLDYAISNPPT